MEMDFSEKLRGFSKRAEALKSTLGTEEATKTSLVMPFFQMLGYDVFNPGEFTPEFTADVGIKKGEKVDFAILKDGLPSILIEAKWVGEKLEKHDSQLFRYFGTTQAKFAILTNGVIYRFYTDLDEPNKMDEDPFFEFNLLDIKDSDISELKKFHKENFDMEEITDAASELKYSGMIKSFIGDQFDNPTEDFIKHILTNIYSGVRTQGVIDKFRPIVKKSLNQFVNELISDKIKQVIENHSSDDKNRVSEQTLDSSNEEEPVSNPSDEIVTTLEELEAYTIIKSALRDCVDSSRISYKDTRSYFGILLDNNTRKWLCRLYLRENVKYIVIPDEEMNQVRFDFETLDQLYDFSAELKLRVSELDK
jgi:predicted type IV restriction endonuclease